MLKPFSFGNKTNQPTQPTYVLTEQSVVSDLPTEAFNQFVEAFNNLQSNFQVINLDETIESNIEEIKIDTQRALNDSLTSMAHIIDTNRETISEQKKELEIFKDDSLNSAQVRSVPTPFIVHCVERIERQASELSESLTSYESHQNTGNSNEVPISYIDFLTEQYKAVLRTSDSVSSLSSNLDEVKTKSIRKLKMSPQQLSLLEDAEDIISRQSTASQLDRNHKLYIAEQKKKATKRVESVDLFGKSPVQAAPAKGFGLGGLSSSLNKTSTLNKSVGSSTTK